MTSLILPTKHKPHAGGATHTVGDVDDNFFIAEKDKIISAIGQRLIDMVQLKLNRILVAKWIRPEARELGNGQRLYLPETRRDEDIYQGNSGLVLKLGPRCYESDETLAWTDADTCKPGDWVLIRQAEGFRLKLGGWECVVLESERGIKAVIPRPDVVY